MRIMSIKMANIGLKKGKEEKEKRIKRVRDKEKESLVGYAANRNMENMKVKRKKLFQCTGRYFACL